MSRADVTGRYFFGRPIEGTTEFVSAYYMVIVAYLPWAYLANNDTHISVDIFTRLMPRGFAHWLDIAVKIVVLLYLSIFIYQTGSQAINQTRIHEVWQAGTSFIPVWPSRWLPPVAASLMALYLIVKIIDDIIKGPQPRARPSGGGSRVTTLQVAGTSIVMMLILIGLRVPIGVAMGGVAFLGLWYLRNFNVALSVLRDTPFVFAANWDLSAIPMFLLMGAIASNSGIGAALFRAAYAWFGSLPGGLAVATNWACAGFGAASGSSIAAAAVMARLAVPEMLKNKYDKALATGVCASGGTLDALIPPSILFVVYGVFAEVSIAKLLLAGILPGLLTAGVYMIMIVVRCWLNPSSGLRSNSRATTRNGKSAGPRCGKSGRSSS